MSIIGENVHPEDARRTAYEAESRAQAVIESFGDQKFRTVLDQLLAAWIECAPGPGSARSFWHPDLPEIKSSIICPRRIVTIPRPGVFRSVKTITLPLVGQS